MNVVGLFKDINTYLGTEITIEGYFKRPRRKHSNYLFFNIENNSGIGIQAIVKKDEIGEERYRQLTHGGLSENDMIEATGILRLRQSDRNEFYKYELLVYDLKKVR